jgi:uncharacterized membrane protein YgaE (UPF0421/DUF939 family)
LRVQTARRPPSDREGKLRRVELFNASGARRRLRASPLLAIGPSKPGPALRRGFLVALPVGLALILELGLDSPSKGAIGTGALLAGFPAMDAPARPRAAWQAVVAPLIGIAAVLGVLSGSNAFLAIATMAVVGALAGYCFAVSLRLAIAGLSVALSLLIAQDLPLDFGDALPALLLATAGGLLQAAFSLGVWVVGDREEEGGESGWDWPATRSALRNNLTLRSTSFRHGLRFGVALGAGVALYWLLGIHEHGFWIPLTILFVMRPQEDETFRRLALRAIGTAIGLVIATALAEGLRGNEIAIALCLTIATGFAYGLLTVQYALFTAAITVYAVMLADSIGEAALHAADERALGTALGIVIAGAAFLLWPNRGEGGAARTPARVEGAGASPP